MPRYVVDVPDDLGLDQPRSWGVLLEDLIQTNLVNAGMPASAADRIRVMFVPEYEAPQEYATVAEQRAALLEGGWSHRRAISHGPLDRSEEGEVDTRTMVDSHDEPYNLISSELERVQVTGSHTPLLDIDVAVTLMPSKTPGHYHLSFPGTALLWSTYEELLNVLCKCGIIEEGFRNFSVKRKATFIRAYPTPTGFKDDKPPADWGKVT